MTFFTLYKKHRHQRESFTLIEILLVVAVMLITLAFATPIFSGLIRGNAVDHATSIVTSQLALARAAAVRNRRTVALVFPKENTADNTRDFPSENTADNTLAYTACRPCFVEAATETEGTDDTTAEWTFHRWLPNSAWAHIPLGAVIQQVDDSCADELTYNEHPTPDKPTWTIKKDGGENESENEGENEDKDKKKPRTPAEIEVQNVTIGKVSITCRAIVFYPDGSSTQAMYVSIVQSIVNPNDGKPEPKRTISENRRVIRVNPFTGKAGVIY